MAHGNRNAMADELHREQRYLHGHRVLLRAGLSLVAAFSWVFVFQYFLVFSQDIAKALFASLIVYAFSQLTLAVITPFSAAHLRHGVKRALVFGSCLAALSFAILGATLAGYFSAPTGWGILLFGIGLGAYRALYWVPYRLQSANLGGTQGALFELLIALMPAFAGATLVLVALSPLRLLFGASALMALSIVPIFFLNDFGERFEWGYAEVFGNVFDRKYATLSLRAALSGAENTALFLVWPISIFLILGRSYLLFGFVMSASLLVLLAARSIYRGLLRTGFSGGSLPLDVIFSMSAWILRLAAGTPIAIVFADSYAYVSAPAGSPEFISREHASDTGSYLDEFTALQEVAMAFGRIAMCIVVGALLRLLPLPIALAAALIIAAFAAGISTALSYKTRVRAY